MIFKALYTAAILFIGCASVSCAPHARSIYERLPENFSLLSDSQKIETLASISSPDSLAMFIVQSFSDSSKNLGLSDFSAAVDYSYRILNQENRQRFTRSLNELADSLPLPQKAAILYNAGKASPRKLARAIALESPGNPDAELIVAEICSLAAPDSLFLKKFMRALPSSLKSQISK